MEIHKLVKTALTEHKQKIELTQWAIISGISSLFYSEYIRRFRHKEVPVRMVLVPSIKNLSEFFKPESVFIETLSNNLIDVITNHPLIKQYSDAPELVMFKEDNIEIMKTIYDLYISPTITRRIPETISMKFGLNNPNQQMFKETWEIDLFDGRHQITHGHYKYIVEQIVLQLLMLLPTMKKEIEIPEDHINMHMCNNEILTISNDNAICPIHFTNNIINNESVIDLLSFVTNTNIHYIGGGDCCCQKNNCRVDYSVTTGIFNQVMLTRLMGIEFEEK